MGAPFAIFFVLAPYIVIERTVKSLFVKRMKRTGDSNSVDLMLVHCGLMAFRVLIRDSWRE